jgi:hypothetical protein
MRYQTTTAYLVPLWRPMCRGHQLYISPLGLQSLIEWRTSYAFWVIMNGCPSREISRVAFAFPHMYGIASKGGASVNL